MMRSVPALTIAAAALVLGGAGAAHAQAAPIAPPGPPSSPPPPVPNSESTQTLRPTDDSAVALCVNGTWVLVPGTPDDCGERGGLKVAMPPRTAPRTAPRATTAAPLIQPRNEPAPPDATARCKDGTYLMGPLPAEPCAANGGLAARLPVRVPPGEP